MEGLAAALVGLALGTVLGLLGGGGGIVAIPLLVHVLGQSLDQASTTSLLVVAAGAVAGLVPHALAGRVEWRAGALFGLLGVFGAAVGARTALLTDDRVKATGLILLILLGAYTMLSPGREPPAAPSRPGIARLLVAATTVGLITGFFGVGGGFIAVPALIVGAGLAPRPAAATGLLVIVINSAAAFAVRGPGLVDAATLPWLFVPAILAAVGAALLSRLLPGAVLQRAFGVLLLLIAGYDIWRLTLQVGGAAA